MDSLHLNLGCGQIRPVGWVNTDSSINALIQKFPFGTWVSKKLNSRTYDSNNVTYMNLNKNWNYKSNSVTTVYASHLFEHLTETNANKFLSEAYRTLKNGGSIRLVMPDLYLHCKEYLDNYDSNSTKPGENLMWALNLHKSGQYPPEKSMHNIIGFFQGFPHQHKYMYDKPTLKNIVEEHGFKNTIFLEYGKSKYLSNILDVEYNEDLAYENSMYLEAQKLE